MIKASGELTFFPFPKKKDEFLNHLAGIYWSDDVNDAAHAWSLFEKG